MRDHLAPKDLHLNKLGKGPLCNATYQISSISKPSGSEEAIFLNIFIYFYDLNLGHSHVGPSWTLGPSFEQIW